MNKIKVLVPVYNAENYIEKCINSLLSQNFNNYEIIITDDCSTDSTYLKILGYKNNKNIHIKKNNKRIGSALDNIIFMIKNFTEKNDIIVLVDGDDWLYNDEVLSKISEIYMDKNIWMTYGQFIPASKTYGKYCKKIDDVKKYRKSEEWLASHLRTFRRELFLKIDEKDLKDEDDKYYTVAWDCAFMYPMLEMCGNSKYYFIDEILYVYNDLNEINDMKINQEKQIFIANLIKEKNEYFELESL
jgi:glycosyltransferase involved in cell wall biosynthesis